MVDSCSILRRNRSVGVTKQARATENLPEYCVRTTPYSFGVSGVSSGVWGVGAFRCTVVTRNKEHWRSGTRWTRWGTFDLRDPYRLFQTMRCHSRPGLHTGKLRPRRSTARLPVPCLSPQHLSRTLYFRSPALPAAGEIWHGVVRAEAGARVSRGTGHHCSYKIVVFIATFTRILEVSCPSGRAQIFPVHAAHRRV